VNQAAIGTGLSQAGPVGTGLAPWS